MNDPKQDIFVNTEEGLALLCDRLRGQTVLALDTEFLREKTYHAQLCLLQVAGTDVVACVDPLAITNIDPLLDIIYDLRITKVMHSARQDMEILFDIRGELPRPLFDTQVAATLMGFGEQVGYANLVKGMLGIELDKLHTRTDWTQRPLDPEQLKYAADDVRYLFEIYHQQVEALTSKGRQTWLQEDFEELTSVATYAPPADSLWKRVKGKQRLKGVQLAILRDLAIWREERAMKINRPRRWVLKDDVMVDIARFGPRDLNGLEKIRGLEPKTVQTQGEALLALIRQARESAKETWPRLPQGQRMTPEQEVLVDVLMAVVRKRGSAQEVSPALLASRKDIEAVILGQTEVPILHGWRGELAGHELQLVLSGERVLQVLNGKLEIRES